MQFNNRVNQYRLGKEPVGPARVRRTPHAGTLCFQTSRPRGDIPHGRVLRYRFMGKKKKHTKGKSEILTGQCGCEQFCLQRPQVSDRSFQEETQGLL